MRKTKKNIARKAEFEEYLKMIFNGEKICCDVYATEIVKVFIEKENIINEMLKSKRKVNYYIENPELIMKIIKEKAESMKLEVTSPVALDADILNIKTISLTQFQQQIRLKKLSRIIKKENELL